MQWNLFKTTCNIDINIKYGGCKWLYGVFLYAKYFKLQSYYK